MYAGVATALPVRGMWGAAGVHHHQGPSQDQHLWVAHFGHFVPWCGGQVVAEPWHSAQFADWGVSEPTMCAIVSGG